MNFSSWNIKGLAVISLLECGQALLVYCGWSFCHNPDSFGVKSFKAFVDKIFSCGCLVEKNGLSLGSLWFRIVVFGCK